ncbi:glycosyltransferase [Flagellimonas myxillae]|uniref:glycosyltransferase n=1 Tax=Flagellimonas myxillae TaxID=2942214 RepID=UPI00201EF569|nr:glycosyltransferase family 2 protein [Muricauda myxillae]MCL6266670.1 glycosyltransferase [Muricauda myxillae]
MIEKSNAIALVTPLKDEIENIGKFIANIESLTMRIKCLVIVENDSTDGSKEYLEKIAGIKNVEHFKVLNINFEDTSYRVGIKYATIIDKGLQFLKNSEFYNTLDFIGILDCDVFPEKEYYQKLVDFLNADPSLGVASGITYTEEGKQHIADINFVRGNCRLWKKECLENSGYLVVPTADTVSLALAHLNGWKTKTLKSAKVVSREINVRLSNQKSKGYHAYFRGHTLLYALLKFFYLAFAKRNFKRGYDYLAGYVQGILKSKPRISDKKVKKYFRYYLTNKILGRTQVQAQ